MIRLLGGSLWASKAVRLALFCASVSLGVAALSVASHVTASWMAAR